MDGGLTASRLEPLRGGSLLFTTKSWYSRVYQKLLQKYPNHDLKLNDGKAKHTIIKRKEVQLQLTPSI